MNGQVDQMSFISWQ